MQEILHNLKIIRRKETMLEKETKVEDLYLREVENGKEETVFIKKKWISSYKVLKNIERQKPTKSK